MSILYTLIAAVKKPDSVPDVAIDNALVTTIFNAVLAAAGAVAVVFIIWGGIQYTLSQGDASKIKKAKDTLLYSIVGLIIVMFSFVILNYVIGQFR